MTVARTVLQPETATQDDVTRAARVPVSMFRRGRWASPRHAAESVGSIGGGERGGGAGGRRNDAFVGGQDVVDHVVDAEVVRLKGELV